MDPAGYGDWRCAIATAGTSQAGQLYRQGPPDIEVGIDEPGLTNWRAIHYQGVPDSQLDLDTI